MPKEVREKVTRMGLECLGEYATPNACARDLAPKLGVGVEQTISILADKGVRISPRTYRAVRDRTPPARTLTDAAVVDKLKGLYDLDRWGRVAPETMFGRRKMVVWLRRNGFPNIGFRAVDRLMRHLGMSGLVRGKGVRTTRPGKNTPRPEDLLERDFRTDRPDIAWVGDFTYVSTHAGFAYTAFVHDLYSRRILGWACSTSMTTQFVEDALKMAVWTRISGGHPIQVGPLVNVDDKPIYH